ncbi:MAG: hypothetical protein KA745_13140 [Gemmatimonadales bacterium]|nr:hypothetical protein [Gemmatimonadales bacterium]
MRRWIVILLLAAACTSAGDGPATETTPEGLQGFSTAALNPVMLTGEPFIGLPTLGTPRDMLAEGEWLWVSDRAGEPFLHLVHTTRQVEVATFGRKGEGPGDFGGFPQLSLRPGDSGGVWGYDERQFRMTRVTHDSIPRVTTLRLEYPQIAFWGGWVGPTRIAQVGDFDTNRVMLVDTVGVLHAMHTVPLLGPDSVGIEARRNAATGITVCADPAGGRFTIAYVAAGRVELHDTAGSHQLAAVPFPSNGDFGRGKDGKWTLRTPWRYYAGCTATSTAVYALFAGHTDDGHTIAARQVHRFAWDGTLLGVLQLDHPASVVAVSGDTLLYTGSAESDSIIRYRLPRAVALSTSRPH